MYLLNSHVTASGDTPANVRERTLLIAIHQYKCTDEGLSDSIITNTCPLNGLLKIKNILKYKPPPASPLPKIPFGIQFPKKPEIGEG